MRSPKISTKIRKKIIACLLALVVSTNAFLISPRPAQAAIGAILLPFGAGAAIPLLIAGGITTGTGALTFVTAGVLGDYVADDPIPFFIVSLFGLVIGSGIGLILLDADRPSHPIPPEFASLSNADLKTMDVAPGDFQVFVTELPEINAIATDIAETLIQKGQASFSDAHIAWNQYFPLLQPESVRVLQKISSHMMNSTVAQRLLMQATGVPIHSASVAAR